MLMKWKDLEVGDVLCLNKKFIKRSRRFNKLYGERPWLFEITAETKKYTICDVETDEDVNLGYNRIFLSFKEIDKLIQIDMETGKYYEDAEDPKAPTMFEIIGLKED